MARLEVHAEAGVTFDSSDQWILLGMMMTGFVLATSMLLVGVDDRSRWRDRRPLRALGVRRSTVVVSEVISGGVAGVVAVALASGSSALLTAAYLRVNDEHLQSTEPYVAVAAGGVLVCLLMALASGLIQARLEDFRTGAT
jgi:predicted lysophospholipase L1 biosynthesis ABC-type transport system permease subunit